MSGDGTKLIRIRIEGTYEVEYDSEYESFFLVLNDNDNVEIENLNVKPEIFPILEREIILFLNGDAYDALEDDDTLYGLEIIECKPRRLILKDLETMDVYDYESYNLDLMP